jgi:hypothetical protein
VEAGDSPPADGWYTLSSDSVLEFGAFGRIARCSVEAGNRPTVLLELPELSEQLDLYGDKRIAFAKNGHVQLEVPTYATGIDATALCGTPADRSLPSANARQSISVTGRGLGIGDYLVLFTIDETGCKEAGFVSVESVGADGRTAQFVLPRDVTTDEVFLVDDYSRARFVLQIVPCITGFRDPFGPFSGTGFVEGGMTAFVGSEEYLDTGPGDDDGIDVRGENTNFVLTAPFDPTGPVHVETEGGSSNVFQP